VNRCRSCGAEILWARTTSGKPMPLDREPSANGNVLLRDGVAQVLGPLDVAVTGEPLYLSHFATCPSAASHRKVA
jgi:hypothetical protein